MVTKLYRQEPTAQFLKLCMFVSVLIIIKKKGICHNVATFFKVPHFQWRYFHHVPGMILPVASPHVHLYHSNNNNHNFCTKHKYLGSAGALTWHHCKILHAAYIFNFITEKIESTYTDWRWMASNWWRPFRNWRLMQHSAWWENLVEKLILMRWKNQYLEDLLLKRNLLWKI